MGKLVYGKEKASRILTIEKLEENILNFGFKKTHNSVTVNIKKREKKCITFVHSHIHVYTTTYIIYSIAQIRQYSYQRLYWPENTGPGLWEPTFLHRILL